MLKDALVSNIFPSISRALQEVSQERKHLPAQIKVYVLRNHTIDNIATYLGAIGFVEGINVSCIMGDYDTIEQEVFNSNAPLYTESPDIVICSIALENFCPNILKDGIDVPLLQARLDAIISALTTRSNAMIVMHPFLLPVYLMQGLALGRQSQSIDFKIREINAWLLNRISQERAVFGIDINVLEQRIVNAPSRDLRFWYMAKALWTNALLKEFAFEIIKLARALRGKSKKCLILDCDGTLWGGVVGEDGINGIKLDPYDYPGRVYYDFQQLVLSLINRGVLVALASKNNHDDVVEVFRHHPHCLIKESHVAVAQINWDNKADNIRQIASKLNIGLDSIVFVDDSSVECALVKEMLPAVTVLQVPTAIYEYPSVLLKEGLFDTLVTSTEDVKRTIMMHQEQQRQLEQGKFTNLDDFLGSLSLKASIDIVDASSVSRVAQLTQKTNQFNLTTRRYTEMQLLAKLADPRVLMLSISLADKFGDYGIVGTVLVQSEVQSAMIDVLLLSCRALGRYVEDVLMHEVMSLLKQKGISQLRGFYIPTPKNVQVSELYLRYGFKRVESQDNGYDEFYKDLTDYVPVWPKFYHTIKHVTRGK